MFVSFLIPCQVKWFLESRLKKILYHQAHSSHGGLGETMDYDEAGSYLLLSIYFPFIYLFIQGRDLDSPMDIITQLIGSITASIGRFCAWEWWTVRFI